MGQKRLFGVLAIAGGLFAATPAAAQQDVLQCDGSDATIVQSEWTESVDGTTGDDVIVINYAVKPETEFFPMEIYGYDGDDKICVVGTPTEQDPSVPEVVIEAGPGNDTIIGGDGTDAVIGNEGDDLIFGGPGPDYLHGDDGKDQIFGNEGADLLNGDGGDDVVTGGLGADVVSGGFGDDRLVGGPGDDLLFGEEGKDTLFGGIGDDHLYSKSILPFRLQQVSINSYTNNRDFAGSRMFGGPGDDLLIGSNRWDRLQGGPGDDVLLGLEGRDWMRGGSGNDILMGGLGIDDLNGNHGRDRLVLVGADVGKGGFGVDRCILGPAADSAAVSCESEEPPGPEWDNLLDAGLISDWVEPIPGR